MTISTQIVNTIFENLVDLPVMGIVEDVVKHATAGGISIVVSVTGSGKTLIVPTAMAVATGQTIHVLEPKRHLAANSAESLCYIGGSQIGDEIGYRVGMRGSSEEYTFSQSSSVVYETYGRALNAKSLLDYEHVILDEVHETAMDITIVQALLLRRYEEGNPPKSLVILSATLDVEANVEYWKDFNPKVFDIAENTAFSCERRWEKTMDPADAVLSLLEQGRRGILVFVEGVGEISKVLNKLNATPSLPPCDIRTISGSSSFEERKAAFAPMGDLPIVLVGTNVIESGVNLPWVDAGVSSGKKKESDVAMESGAVSLMSVTISMANVVQQMGRTSRFRNSVFVLCGESDYGNLPTKQTPEILRLPLTELIMHCAGIGIDPRDLTFTPQPDVNALNDAVSTLKTLGLLDADGKMTDDGSLSQELPVGIRTAALLCHAAKLNIVSEMMPLAAVFEVGGIRKNPSEGHFIDRWSDFIDAACAFSIMQTVTFNSKGERKERMDDLRVGSKKLRDARELVAVLEKVTMITANYQPYLGRRLDSEIDARMRQCILAASLDRLAYHQAGYIYPIGGTKGYRPAQGAVVNTYHGDTMSCNLRTITPRNKESRPFTVAENITKHPVEDFHEFNKIRPGTFTFSADNGYDTIAVNGIVFSRSYIGIEVEQPAVITTRPEVVSTTSVFKKPHVRELTDHERALQERLLAFREAGKFNLPVKKADLSKMPVSPEKKKKMKNK